MRKSLELSTFDPTSYYYHSERDGNLILYCLKRGFGSGTYPQFLGAKYYFKLQKLGLLKPKSTLVRVSRSPIPDLSLVVRDDFNLEGYIYRNANMSETSVPGIYEPREILNKTLWSVTSLDFNKFK